MVMKAGRGNPNDHGADLIANWLQIEMQGK